jgi:hypothetical protein
LKELEGQKPLQKSIKKRSIERSYKAVITARPQSSRNKERDKKNKKHLNNYTRLGTH